MSHESLTLERRGHLRHNAALPVTVHAERGTVALHTQDISLGGVCVRCETPDELSIGDHVDVDVTVPGYALPQRVAAEVRWKRADCAGLAFRQLAHGAIAAFVMAATLATPGLASANNSAVVPGFDPNADVTLDMNGGGERPDDTQVLTAFEKQFEAFDQCVAKAKHNAEDQLPGDVNVEVLLNPKGERPLGINAAMSTVVDEGAKLQNCLRTAIADGPYPAYDGPPIVVEFSFELDPGSDYVEFEDA